MSDTTKRDAVLQRFTRPIDEHHVMGGFWVVTDVDAMADYIVRLERLTAKLRGREHVMALHEDTGRMWDGPRYAIPPRYFEVTADEQKEEE